MMRWLAIAAGMLLAAAELPVHAAPDIERWRTSNGAEVLMARTEALPILDVQLTFDAGSARDGDQPGLARLTSNLLLEGSAGQDAGAIARRFERYGAEVSTDSGRDMGRISLRSLTVRENLGPTVKALREVLAKPGFPKAAVERTRSRMLVGLRQASQDPSALGEKALARAIYGDHPYAHPPGGTLDSLPKITRDQVRGFHQEYYTAANLTIGMVGDLERSRAEAIAEQLSSAFPRGQATAPLPRVPALSEAKTIRIPFATKQTQVLMAQPALARGDDAYIPLYTANHVLGGSGLVSILAREMREQRGLSYSTYSVVSPLARKGRFEVGTQVRNEAFDRALAVLRETLKRFHANGPSKKQLKAAKNNIVGSFPLNIDSNSGLVNYLSSIGFYDLPLDSLATFVDRVEAVDRSAATQTFREQIDPGKLVTVLVGPASVIGADSE